jgi:hypothetical protein
MKHRYSVESDFVNHFQALHQVFMYITDRCNLECEQCIYKPSINHFGSPSFVRMHCSGEQTSR